MSQLIRCENLSKQFGARTLFQGVNIGVDEDECLGVIGPNGAGKSTLLKIIAELETPDTGQRITRGGLSACYVPQTHRFDPQANCLDVVAAALHDAPEPEAERRVAAGMTLDRLGFADPEQAVGQLSGGWAKRLAIACALVREPELLLLDEPTNHLDLEGVSWLEDLLSQASFASVVITHDRYFLETTATRILELNACFPGGTFTTTGSYRQFLERREAFLEAQRQQQANLQNQIRTEKEWLSRGPKARGTKSKARIEKAHELMRQAAELRARNHAGQTAGVGFEGTARRTHRLIEATGLSKQIAGKPLFQDLDIKLSPGRCLGLLGANGSGKSTLIRTLIGEITPDAGRIDRADNLRVVHFSQHREDLDPTQSLRQALAGSADHIDYRGQRIHFSGWAKRFLFRPDQFNVSVGDLSGGEQSRILIARLMLQPADVLVLDEPTNDLDIATLEVLEQSIDDFPGAAMLVTHDRYMLQRVADELLWLDGRGGAHRFADFEQYQRKRAAVDAETPSKPRSAKPTTAKPAAPPARTRKLSYKEQLEWDGMEQAILAAEEQVETLQSELDEPAVQSDHARMADLCRQLEAAQAEVDRLYERWSELEAKQKPATA